MTLDNLYLIDILNLYIVTMTKYRSSISYNPDIIYGQCKKTYLWFLYLYKHIDIYLKIHNEFYFWNVICRFVRGWTKILPNVLMKYVLLLLINFPPQLRWQVDIWGISLGFVYSQCIQQWLLHLLCFTSDDARRCWEHSHANSLLTLILAILQRLLNSLELRTFQYPG